MVRSQNDSARSRSDPIFGRTIGKRFLASHRNHRTKCLRNMENFAELCCRSRGGTDHATHRWTQHRNQTPSIGTIPFDVARSGASWLTVRVRGRSGREHTQSREGVPHEAPGFTCHPRSRSRSLPESAPRKKGVRFAKCRFLERRIHLRLDDPDSGLRIEVGKRRRYSR